MATGGPLSEDTLFLIKTKRFVTVIFVESESVRSVPTAWLSLQNGEAQCSFPEKSSLGTNPDKAVSKLVSSCTAPGISWESFSVRILLRSATDDFTSSKSCEKIAQETSDVDANPTLGRGHRKVVRKNLETEEDTTSDETDSPVNADRISDPPRSKKSKADNSASKENRFMENARKETAEKTTGDNPVSIADPGEGPSVSGASLNKPAPVAGSSGLSSKRRKETSSTESSTVSDTTDSVSTFSDVDGPELMRDVHAMENGTILCSGCCIQCQIRSNNRSKIQDEKLDFLQQGQAEMMIMLRRRTVTNPSNEPVVNVNPVLARLKFDTMEQFELFEGDLQNNHSFRNSTRGKLVFLGGTPTGTAVNKMLHKLLTDDLAMRFTFFGVPERNKMQFSTTESYQLILETIRSREDLPDANEERVRKAVMEWFRQSKGRKEKALAKANKTI